MVSYARSISIDSRKWHAVLPIRLPYQQ
jgi:WD40 repeat protein